MQKTVFDLISRHLWKHAFLLYFLMNYSQWSVWESYNLETCDHSQLFHVVVLTFNLSKIHLHAEVLTLWKPRPWKSVKPSHHKCKLHIWDSRYTFHAPLPHPTSLSPGSIQEEGWMGVHWHHAWPKFLASIQVSAGKLEAGFLEALLCMLHFLYLQWHDCH